MNNDHETVLAALLTHLSSAVVVSFTGNTTGGSDDITNVSTTTGMFVGLPVFGPGVPLGATITAINATTVTLSQDVTADGTTAAFKTGFLTTGRRVQHWSQVAAQPALFIRHVAADDEFQGNIHSVTTIEVEIWIYSKAGENPDVAPDVTLNNLVKCVREAFNPDDPMQWRFTLGGRAHWCRIEGRSEYDPGDLDQQSKAIIPVRITLP